MNTYRWMLASLLIFALISGCTHHDCSKKKEQTSKQKKRPKSNPCENPQTVKELLACANTVGIVDTYWISVGSVFNKGACGNPWNDKDTILNVIYKDSITLWRVNQFKNTPGNYSGSWFTNYSAKAAGLTKEETLNLFALNPCPDEKGSWTTCHCPNGNQPIDSVIQYEVKVRIGPSQPIYFGVVGKNAFGQGGPMQWHIPYPKNPRFRLLEQVRWE